MLEVNETITGHSRIDFDKVKVRRAMRKIGAEVRKDARRRVARRAISGAGEYPGRRSGALARSIKAKVFPSGFLVRVAPYKTAEMDAFYPAYLDYGVLRDAAPTRLAPGEGVGRSNRRRRGQVAEERAARVAGGYRLAPRKNYMADALEARRESVRVTLRSALLDSLVPR
ncbi:hypothetical protein [Thauera phenylacetica]|uniref:hypothetical protein n=1 Tax=Thauera phenylacetica TaxID=164400 RepID=UPI0039E6FCA1